MTRYLLFASNLLGFGLTALAFASGGKPWLAAVLLLFAGFWVYASLRRWDWSVTLGLFVAYGFIAAGFLLDLSPALLFPAAFLLLAGWDLSGMQARLRLADPGEDTTPLQVRHLLRLVLTLLVGAGFVWAALTLHLKLSFEWTALLAILVAFGLGRLVSRLLKRA